MNKELLKTAEKKFLMTYPDGFNTPEMIEIAKKHRVEKIAEQVQEDFIEKNFEDIEMMSEILIKLVSRSSMVSLFEKPKFRDHMRGLNIDEKSALVGAVKEMLYGKEEEGFSELVKQLKPYKLAKWTLVSVFLAYYNPSYDVFMKPTTVKNVVKTFDLEDLVYSPTPSYDFYNRYRAYINEMKNHVDASLSPNNPAFSGFLMMIMDK